MASFSVIHLSDAMMNGIQAGRKDTVDYDTLDESRDVGVGYNEENINKADEFDLAWPSSPVY